MIRPRAFRKPPGTNSCTPVESESSVEARMAHLQATLDVLTAEVRQAQQLASLGTAAAMIAHEVNNLLTPILSYAGAALDAGDDDLQKKALEVTVRNVQMLIAMSQRVLEISAAKATQREAVSVREAAEDGASCLCRDLRKDGIVLSIDVSDSLSVWADPLQLRQVLFNLFLNAREAMARSHSGRVTVSGRQRDNKVVIEVRNTGDPIPPELVPRVFEPFQTSKPADRDSRARCSGLGLALCRDLVEENGGTISVTSTTETGTTFTIVLPTEGNEETGAKGDSVQPRPS